MRRRTKVVVGASVLILGIAGTATTASADEPPGLLGYEGQPGNQGDGGGVPPGLLGYEGQPGNQGDGGGVPPGLLGYEGQPGNQGG